MEPPSPLAQAKNIGSCWEAMMIVKESGIYKIFNIITYDFYTGSAVNLRNRWNEHRRDLRRNLRGNTHFQNAWNKYGESNFVFLVIELCEKEILLVREQWYIDTEHPAYNINPIAGSCLGIKRSDETKHKMSEANKGKHPSEETRNKMHEVHLGRHHTEETKRNMSEAKKGNTYALGYKHTEETRAKVSEASKGNMSALGYKHTEEARAKISKAQMGELNHNFGKYGELNCLFRKHRSDEAKCKMSEALKKSWARRREAQNLVLTSGDLLPISEGL